jgi:hypothetical protein
MHASEGRTGKIQLGSVMETREFRFTRIEGREHKRNGNQPSTDAYGVVTTWSGPEKDRDYRKLKDEGALFEARLTFSDDDRGALDELFAKCAKLDLECSEIPSKNEPRGT